MTEKMKKYLSQFKDRKHKNVLNEWYVRDLPIKEQIECMEDHEKMLELFDEYSGGIIAELNEIHHLETDNDGGFSNWKDGVEQLTSFAICEFFPAESLKDHKYVDWLEDYSKLVSTWLKKVIELRKKYNGDEPAKYKVRTDKEADFLSYKLEDFLEIEK